MPPAPDIAQRVLRWRRQFGRPKAECRLRMPDFILPHLIDDFPRTPVPLRQALKMAIEMGLDLALRLGQEAQIPFFPKASSQDTQG